MKLWQSLYGVIWLAFLDLLVIMFSGIPSPVPIHIVLGFAVIALAVSNYARLDASPAPARLKRIARSTRSLAVGQAVLGIIMVAWLQLDPQVPFVYGLFQLVHIVNGIAIISQVSSTATGYDMWEEKEFTPTQTPEAQPSPAP